MRRIRLLPLALSLLLGLAGAVRTPRADAAPAPPVVVFETDDAQLEPQVKLCQDLWRRLGPEVTAEVLQGGAAIDTVTCLVATTATFQRVVAAGVPDWGVGVAIEPGRHIAVDGQRTQATSPGIREVFVHEMTHALLMQASRGVRLPTWLHEGAAMRASGQWRWTDTVHVVMEGDLPSLARLQGPFPGGLIAADRAYRTSLLAVNYLESRHGPHAVARIAAAAGRLGDFRAAFRETTHEDYDDFVANFAGAMRLRFGWVLLLVRWPTLFVVMALLVIIGVVRRQLRDRRRLRAMADEESA